MRSATGKLYEAGAVTLMTLHGSKGLEFPVVFLAGVRQGKIPLESPKHPAMWKRNASILRWDDPRAG